MKTILITQCHVRFGLNVAKSLTQSNYLVVAGGLSGINLCSNMENIVGEFSYPDPFQKPEKFIEIIDLVAEEHNVDLILPIHEDIFVFSKFKMDFKNQHLISCPKYDDLLVVHDKYNLLKVAKSSNIPYPETKLLSFFNDDNISEVRYPLIVKPRFGEGTKGVSKINNQNEFNRIIKSLDKYADFYIVQNFIEGKGIGTGCLIDNNKIIALSSHLRLREFPISGGTSTARLTFRNEKLEKYVFQLVRNINLKGILMVEFKYSPDDDEFTLLDINPRYWGGLSTAIESGVDFPKIHIDYELHNNKPKKTIYPNMIVESRWLFGEIGGFFTCLIKLKWTRLPSFFKKEKTADKVCYEDSSINAFIQQLRSYSIKFISSINKNYSNNSRTLFFTKNIKNE